MQLAFTRNRIVFALVFGILLSFLAAGSTTIALDINASRFVQSTSLPFLLPLMAAVSYVGNWPYVLFSYAFGITLLLAYRNTKATFYLCATTVAYPIIYVLKSINASDRPTAEFVTLHEIVSGYGFPSGHVLFYTVFYGFLIYAFRQTPAIPRLVKGIIEFLCILLIALIGMSRIYLGVHWLTDVIGGYLFGFIVLATFIALYRRSMTND